MRQARGCERARRRELVVGGDERAAFVQHRDAERCEPVERPEAGLDAVERPEDVEATERDVAGRESLQRLCG